MNKIFVEYLKTLPIIPRKDEKGRIVVVLGNRGIRSTFPDVTRAGMDKAIKWLNENKLCISYSKGKYLKELVRYE